MAVVVQKQRGMLPPGLALLHGIARCDLAAVQRELAAGSPLEWEGLGALHLCALCDFPEAVPLLVAHGADVNAPLAASVTENTAGRVQGVGVPQQQSRALFSLHRPKTPLDLAVCCGADCAAAALLAAGAPAADAYTQLLAFAEGQSAGPGSDASASDVPAAVERLARVLLAAQLPSGAGLAAAHAVAAKLAFPVHRSAQRHYLRQDSFPPCAWLLRRLLLLHLSGSVPGSPDEQAAAVWAACSALLEHAEGRPAHGTDSQQALDKALASWLALPAAASISSGMLNSAAVQMCQLGLTAAALPALIALPQVHQLLAAQALRPLGVGRYSLQPEASLVHVAALAGPAALDAALAAGGAVTLNDVNRAALEACAASGGLAVLKLLLSRGVPPVPLEGSALPPASAEAAVTVCPIYAVLDHHCNLQQQEWGNAEVEGFCGPPDYTVRCPSVEIFQEQHHRCLAVMECLVDAGYRPVSFASFTRRPGVQPCASFYPPDDEYLAKQWELNSSSRWLWLAALRAPWSPERHLSFPPAFQKAASALLLAAHRGSSAPARAAGSGAALLGSLPQEVLHAIVAAAAYPLSAWRPKMKGGLIMQLIEDFDPEDHIDYDDEPYYDDPYRFCYDRY